MDSSFGIAGKEELLEALGFRRASDSFVPFESSAVPGNRHRTVAIRPSMGTLVSITAIHASRDLMDDALGQAFEEMDRVVALLNRYDPESAVSILNDQGRVQAPPPELFAVLEEALVQNRISQGAFDPTVQPLVDHLRGEGFPGPGDSLARARGSVSPAPPRRRGRSGPSSIWWIRVPSPSPGAPSASKRGGWA